MQLKIDGHFRNKLFCIKFEKWENGWNGEWNNLSEIEKVYQKLIVMSGHLHNLHVHIS